MERRVLGPVVATMLVAATGILAAAVSSAAAAPVSAAACPGASGVTVVVDYNEVGGPTRAGCDPDGGGKSASQVFPDAGFSLEYHPRQPGYVCKVTGLPDDRPCLENDSFWSLWWSDGESGEWVFSNQGVGGMTVPDGGYVAFAWHEGGGSAQPPDVVPTPHEEPSPQPSQQPSGSQGGNGGQGGNNDDDRPDGDNNGGDNDGGANGTSNGAATSTSVPTTSSQTGTTESASPDPDKKKRSARKSDEPSESARESSTVPAAGEITAGPPASDLATDTSADDGGSLPTWIGLGLAVLVLSAAALVTLLRRRSP